MTLVDGSQALAACEALLAFAMTSIGATGLQPPESLSERCLQDGRCWQILIHWFRVGIAFSSSLKGSTNSSTEAGQQRETSLLAVLPIVGQLYKCNVLGSIDICTPEGKALAIPLL